MEKKYKHKDIPLAKEQIETAKAMALNIKAELRYLETLATGTDEGRNNVAVQIHHDTVQRFKADGSTDDVGTAYAVNEIMAELGCKSSTFSKYRREAEVPAKRRGQMCTAAERKRILKAAEKSSDRTIAQNAKRALGG